MVASEGILEVAEEIESKDFIETVESEHRGHSIYTHLETCFDDYFNKENKREKRFLDPSKRSHRKTFVEVHGEFSKTLPIENESNCTEMSKDGTNR